MSKKDMENLIEDIESVILTIKLFGYNYLINVYYDRLTKKFAII